MRRPTPDSKAFAWWKRAIAGENPPIHEGEPECGYFLTRAYRRGPLIPASITLRQNIDWETCELTEPEVFECEIAGRKTNAERQWPYLAGRPITKEEYEWQIARLPLLKKLDKRL